MVSTVAASMLRAMPEDFGELVRMVLGIGVVSMTVSPERVTQERPISATVIAAEPMEGGGSMASITESAAAFFAACETGKGWEALAEIKTLRDYTNWMQGIMTVLTDGSYEIKSFATDAERNNVCAYGVFTGTHLAGGPCPPTGKTTRTDYVYVMQFAGGRIVHMTKIWHSGLALKELGWA
jgi:ketosteroid isomerase-like protein